MELYSVVCCDLNKKEMRKRGDICICATDLLCCTAKTNAILESNYVVVQSLSCVRLFATPELSMPGLPVPHHHPKFMSIASVMPRKGK